MTKKPRIIILNGPPQSGKDTTGALLEALTGAARLKFADPLKNNAHAMVGLLGVAADHFEGRKDERMAIFGGLSPRQFYIRVSEEFIKPIFGAEHYGKLAVPRVAEQLDMGRDVVVTDCGFVPEVMPLVDAFLDHLDVQLWHVRRPGKTFSGDSRSYISVGGVESKSVWNDHDVPHLLETVKELL